MFGCTAFFPEVFSLIILLFILHVFIFSGLFPGMESCRNALMNDINESRHENHHISSKKKSKFIYVRLLLILACQIWV